MEKIDNSHLYKDLRDPKQELRVLELLPAERAAPITIKLSHHKLSESINYDALSYTWGDSSITTTIRLNNEHDFQIPLKLEQPLRDLRSPQQSLFIWIDAICINQRNIDERNAQVQIMRRIYEQAWTVRIWLDLEIDPNSPPFVKLRTLTIRSTIDDLGNDGKFWTPVSEIGKQTYWTRVWIQQEVAYAKNVTLYCRENQISFASLNQYQRLIEEKNYNDFGTVRFSEWLTLENHFMLFPPSYRPTDVLSGQPIRTRRFKNIFDALKSNRHLGATDPRDHVFGLLGLVEDYSEGDIVIDYNLSTKDVYRNVAQYGVDTYGNLTFLLCTRLNDNNGSNDLPSWMPDWGQSNLTQPNLEAEDFESTFETSYPNTNPPSIDLCGSFLHATGFKIDRVKSVFGQTIVATAWRSMMGWFDICDFVLSATTSGTPNFMNDGTSLTWSSLLDMHSVPPIFRSLVRIVWMLSDEDYEPTMHKLAADLWAMMSQYMFRRPNVSDEDYAQLFEELQLWIYRATIISRENTILVTERNGLALATTSSLPGDEIWTIFRCRMPMILRPNGDKYVVVGPAYYDGHMRGEDLVRMPNVVKAGEQYGEYVIQDITLQ